MNVLLDFLASTVKLVYLVPFLFYYVIAKRMFLIFNKDGKVRRLLKLGLILSFFGAIIIIIMHFLGWVGVFTAENTSLDTFYLSQGFSSLFIGAGYFLIFFGLVNIKQKKLESNVFGSVYLFIFLLLFLMMNISDNLLFIFALTFYSISIFFLSYSFLLMADILASFEEPLYWFCLIGAILIILDPVFIIYDYTHILVDMEMSTLDAFFEMRTQIYLSNIISLFFVSIPHIKLLKDLFSKRKITINKDDKVSVKVLKTYINYFEKIIGTVSSTVFIKCLKDKGFEGFNIYSKESYTKLSEEESLMLLDYLIDKFHKILGPVSYRVLINIKNKTNMKIINKILLKSNVDFSY